MIKIKKEIQLQKGYKLSLLISDGIAVMSCNHPNVLKQIYLKGKADGKNFEWDEKRNCLVEKFENLNAKEIEKLIDKDIETMKRKQKEVMQKLSNGI